MDENSIVDERVDELREEERQKAKAAKKKHIQEWFDRIQGAIAHDKFYRERWCKDRKVARGEYDSAVSTNLISALLAVLSAFLYAKNPDVSATPSDSVDRRRLTEYRQFAQTIQVIVSRLFHDAKLKRVAKRWIRGAQTVGIAWIKAAMQMEYSKEPIIEDRINDIRDQIENINSKQIRINLEEKDRELLVSELNSNIIALESRGEISSATGLALDYMDPADVIVAPECGEVENYLRAPWICFDAYKNEDEVLAITGWETQEELQYLKAANRYYKRPRADNDSAEGAAVYVRATTQETESTSGFYLVREVWCLDDGVVYTLIDGCTEDWAREPYAPVTGRRFYPVFALAWHWIDGERYPQSDVSMLTKLQEEYNEVRSDYRIHRQRSRPGMVFDEEAVDPDSVKAVAGSVTAEYTGIKLVGKERDINQVFAAKKYAPVDPGLYDTTPVQRDMEKISGAQEALTQSSLSIEKTATEASIQEAGRGARTGARLDDMEDSLTELAEYVVHLMLQLFDMADAERYAGPDAVWMNLTVDQALMLFNVTIKAGSTGKPRKKTDADQWPVLIPLISDLIMKIGEARMKGQEYAAKPLIALLKETLDRADDTADIEMFLPVIPEEQIQAGNEPDPLEVAKARKDTADSIDSAASAVEKLPSLALSPEVRGLLGLPVEQDTSLEAVAAALQGSGQTDTGPNPITEV